MFIYQIVSIAARILNLKNVVKYIENKTISGNALEEVDKLTKLTNLVICELSVMGIYIIRSQIKSPSDGKIIFTALRTRPIKILGVFDDDGNSYPFTVHSDCLMTDPRVTNLTYAYSCNEGLDDKIQFEDYRISAELIAPGVVAEYLLTLNDFDGAVYWHEKFVNNLSALKDPKNPTNVMLKERSFI